MMKIPAAISLLMAFLPAGAFADCHHAGKSYPEGSLACEAGKEFICGAMGVWHARGTQCKAKADVEQSHATVPEGRNSLPDETGSKGADPSEGREKS